MRRQAITGNWKMNLDLAGARELSREIRNRVRTRIDGDVAVCPPYPYLDAVAQVLRGSTVGVGAQDLDLEDFGARTGAVSAPMLRSVGCTFVLVGHSERRDVFGDSDEVVAAKLRKALEHDLDVTLCVGEHLEERRSGRTFQVVLGQVTAALAGVPAAQMTRIMIAYEPVWAIGTGQVATPEQAQEVHRRIRAHMAEIFDAVIAGNTRIQYGGSVKPANAAALLSQADIDGALVGGASLRADPFIDIVRATARG